MHYRHLGQTDLLVFSVGIDGTFGGHAASDPTDLAARHRNIETLRSAVHAGMNYIDAIAINDHGNDMSLLGEALDGLRTKSLLAIGYEFGTTPRSHEHRTEQLLATLDRLRTNHLDVLQLHCGCWEKQHAEHFFNSGMLDWLDEMHRRGYCRHTGISADSPSIGLDRILRTDRIDVLKITYHALNPSACDYRHTPPTGIIPFAKSRGIGIITAAIPAGDTLNSLPNTKFPSLDSGRFARMAANFALSTPEVDCALVTVNTPEEVWACAELAGNTSQRLDLQRLCQHTTPAPQT